MDNFYTHTNVWNGKWNMNADTSFVRVSDGNFSYNFKWISNSAKDMRTALDDGYPYHSLYSFSGIPKPDLPAPYLYGDLWIVTHNKERPLLAVEAMRNIMDSILILHTDIDPQMFRYYLDNRNTVWLRIPAVMFGGECGVPLLPMYHRQMVREIIDSLDTPAVQQIAAHRTGYGKIKYISSKCIVPDTYNPVRPFMFLPPGIQHHGNFTLEIDFNSFMYKSADSLFNDIKNGSNFSHELIAPVLTSLYELYDSVILARYSIANITKLLESINLCPFFRSCQEHPEQVNKEQLDILLNLLALLGQRGLKIALEFGEKKSDCDTSTIRNAFIHAAHTRNLITCPEVANTHGCDGSCGVHNPYELEDKERSDAGVMQNYQERQDGLYYSDCGWNGESIEEIKICSPIFTIGRLCNTDGTGWQREVIVVDPNGTRHQLSVPNSLCMKNNIENLLTLLCDHGLELSSHSKAVFLLKKYFREATPARIKVGTKTLGWHEDCYVFPDMVIGHYDKKPVYFGDTGASHHSGSLADWITRIGVYCKGNSLPMLLIQFALTGPLLKLCGVEGGGLHLYGPSSVGKTTLAHVTGSVCGGRRGKGNIAQWNSTSNALENTAAQHNDGLLVLDEIGEATAETVYKAIYMLTNGQGKERLKADSMARKAHQWLLNYLSTGEKPTSDKIEENRRFQAMAGQEVRSINLPILGLNDVNVFTELHGFATPAALSDHLKRASKEVYGTLFRAFLEKLCGSDSHDLYEHIDVIQKDVQNFVEHICPKEGVGQIHRVALKFGLIGAAGIFAARHGLLPWSELEAMQVAKKWFKVWLEKRGTTGNLEVENAVRAIQDYWARYKESRFCDYDNYDARASRDVSGYYWKQNNGVVFLLKAPIFTDLIKPANTWEVLSAMRKKDMLLLTDKGTIMETKSIAGNNVRGYGFKTCAWLGKAEIETRLDPDETEIMAPYAKFKELDY